MERYEFEIDDNLDLDEFQVVRREFFYHLNEPSITFSSGKIGVNTACIKRLPAYEFVQFLVSSQMHKLVLKPCEESDVHSLRWCSVSAGDKKKPRMVTGRIFFLMVCDLMHWNPIHRYKVMGKPVISNGEELILFDLDSVETYEHTGREGEKGKISRKPVLPIEWQGSFGIPYKDRQRALQVSIFDQNYAVYSVPDSHSENTAEHRDNV